MKNVRPTMFIMLFAAVPVAASAQVPEATDIPASEIETVRQTLGLSIDQQIKIADIGDGNVAVGVLHRGALEDARLADLMQQRVYSLSGGERVRVSLALAFARLPKVLVADELVVGLTPIDQEMLGQALRRVAARGTAVVTSGHDARVLLDISDVILWSVAGTTHHIGSPSEALVHNQFRREYLGPAFA